MTLKTFQFMAENAGPTYDRLDDKEKAFIEKGVNRANAVLNHLKVHGLPKQYHGAGKRVAERVNANPSYLTDEAIYALDNVIAMTVEDQNMYGDLMSAVTTPQTGGARWQNKSYKLDELDVNNARTYPHPDKTFQDVVSFGLGVEPETVEGTGFSIGYTIPWTEIAESAGSIYSPEFYYALKAAERMGVIIDENGWLGGAGLHMHHDTSVKGLLNQSSIQSFTSTGLTSFGGLRTALQNGLIDLKTQFNDGFIALVMTSGLASQMMNGNRHAYSDDPEVVSIRKAFPMIQRAYVSDRIQVTAAPTNTTQRWALVKIGRTLQSRKIVYPLQSKPRQDKKYAEDVSEVLIHGDILACYGQSPFPVTVSDTLTTTDAGYIPNGRLW
jgi:hypothetical protein